jgi:DNA-binding response OmpR family regulator
MTQVAAACLQSKMAPLALNSYIINVRSKFGSRGVKKELQSAVMSLTRNDRCPYGKRLEFPILVVHPEGTRRRYRMSTQGTVLVIDDDKTLLRLLQEALAKAGYQVILASNGIDGLQELYARQPDLVILDVMMPRMDGWETLTRIRQISRVPVIMLTAKDAEQEKVRGFSLGVDDYVTKPFSFAELVARAGAVLRRSRTAAPITKNKRFSSGDLVLDVDAHRVTKGGKLVELTPTEFRLLETLAEHAGRVLTHEQLLEKVWGYDAGEDTGYIKRYIWYLRQKLEDDPTNPQHILTERGFGYSFAAD